MKKISIMRVTNNSPEKFTILRISVLLGLGHGFVTGIRKLVRKLRICRKSRVYICNQTSYRI